MVHFVGAGPGAEDLITLRGARLLQEADVIIYAGSLVNPELLAGRKADAEVHDSAALTRETLRSTARSGSRWIFWTKPVLRTMSRPASVLSLRLLRP